MAVLWWITFHSVWNQEASYREKLQGNRIGLGKNMAAEVAGLPLLTVTVWDFSLAPPFSECKPRPPACYRGTTRLQQRSTLKRIFKRLLINWALWCAVSVCSLHVFLVSLSNDLAVCTVSELVVYSDLPALRLLLVCASCPTFSVRDIIVKFMLQIVCLQIGLTWRQNQPTERAADNGHIGSVIICPAW